MTTFQKQEQEWRDLCISSILLHMVSFVDYAFIDYVIDSEEMHFDLRDMNQC